MIQNDIINGKWLTFKGGVWIEVLGLKWAFKYFSLVTRNFLKLESVFKKIVCGQENRKTVVETLNKIFLKDVWILRMTYISYHIISSTFKTLNSLSVAEAL